jgi:flagellar biosynthesis protein FlhG
MQDQAAGLRRLMGHAPRFLPLGICGTDPALTALASAHLAYALNGRGLPVWVLDEAAAPRNVAACFGLPLRRTLDQALRQGTAADAAVSTVAPGLCYLAINGGMAWLAGIPEGRWQLTVDALTGLPEQPQCLLLHAPPAAEAGSLAMCARDRLLVLPQGRSALTQAYALMKGVERLYPSERWHVLVMQSRDEAAARQTFAALESTARRFLDIRPQWLGSVPPDTAITEAGRRMLTVQEIPAHRPGVQAFRRLAEALATVLAGTGMYQPDEFWLKMWMFSRLTAEAVPEKAQNVPLS